MAAPEQPMPTLPPESPGETQLSDGAVEAGGAHPANRLAPTWVWVTIALLAVALGLGLAALSFGGHGGGAASSKAVAEVQQLLAELTTLNGSLATTNSILANGIQTSSEVSAKANAQLDELSADLAGVQASIGQARATIGPQLKDAVRKRLANAQRKLQSRTATLAGREGRLSRQLVGTLQESGTKRSASLASQIRALRGAVEQQASAQGRLEGRLDSVPARVDRLASNLRHQLALERLHLHRLALLMQQLRARLGPPRPR